MRFCENRRSKRRAVRMLVPYRAVRYLRLTDAGLAERPARSQRRRSNAPQGLCRTRPYVAKMMCLSRPGQRRRSPGRAFSSQQSEAGCTLTLLIARSLCAAWFDYNQVTAMDMASAL
jgi:hypothetical protein